MPATSKEIARRFITAFQAGDDITLESIMIENAVDHNPLPAQRPGRRGVLDTLTMYRTAFPDLTITVENQVTEGDLVAQHGLARGTNTGQLMGVPPTGKPATFAWSDLYRIVDSRITEIWHLEDVAGLLHQLGAGLSPAAE